MGTLKIDCYLSESQIDTIVKEIDKHISDFRDFGINDFEGLYTNNTHVFVDFETLFLNRLELKSVEVLNDDYDLLEEDTAVLKSYLKPIIKSYNDEIESQAGDGYSMAEELAKERYYSKKYAI